MKSPVTITLAALVTGLVFLVYGHAIPGVREFDSRIVQLYTPHDAVIDNDHFSKGLLSFRKLHKAESIDDTYQIIAITDDPDQIFEKSPPSPLDYAVILDSLHEQGQKAIVITTRIAWDDYTDIELQALDGKLANFDRAVIPLPVTRGATVKNIPPSLKRSIVPTSNITGQCSLLPVVNQVTLESHANGGQHTYAGFSHIESNGDDHPNSIQMLAQWEGEGIIPSIELLTLMAAYDITPADITIHCGQSIQLGTNNLYIPIDQFGRTLSSLKENTPPPPLKTIHAETLMETAEQPQPITASPVSIIQATGANVTSTNELSQARLHDLMDTATQFDTPGEPLYFLKTSLWLELIIVVNLSLFIYTILGFSPASRHFLFLLIALLLSTLFTLMMTMLAYWIFLSAPLATLLTAWLLNLLFYRGANSQA